MKTQEILSIIALSLLGLCFLSGLVKMAMKKESHKKPYEQGCTASVFIAVVLLGISQLLTEREPYTGGDPKFKPKFKVIQGLHCRLVVMCCGVQTLKTGVVVIKVMTVNVYVK